MTDLFELAKKAGLVEEPKEEPKRSGLEVALDALKSSKPNSPLIPYYEKLLRKRVDNPPIDSKVNESNTINTN